MGIEFLLILLIVIVGFGIYRYFKQRKILKTLSEEEFRQGYRKAQLIDVREPKEFDGGHILGARNIPLSQMRNRLTELRKDQPIYMYCQNGTRTARAAILLNKKGYNELYQLQGGFKKWNGKIRKSKSSQY
ncbi:Rhodanese-related sulfurtransferase [Sediminibacillus halophilus]|uniref:Rhodanese-related sulfurtransferase n=1 Tax=Sediminibacillus halophilus TaxID=482461 RepID=A0A1G9YE11_9BACI|nr:rhodanese-like domain-containing protein [Sediminibacillus halophilus]SDN07247.1 Rhodanese-related sulfurtransferase [Sediminibacillus halophilus]